MRNPWRSWFRRPIKEKLWTCPACNGVGGDTWETPFCGFCGGSGRVPEHALAQYQRHYVLTQDEIELILIEEFSEICDHSDIQYAASRIMALVQNRRINL